MLYDGDFLKTVEELHRYRGVPIVEIARQLGVSREYLHRLRSNKKRVTPRMFEKATAIFP